MSKGRFLSKRKWNDFRKTKKSKIKWVNKLKFPRKWIILREVTHLSMRFSKRKIINYCIY